MGIKRSAVNRAALILSNAKSEGCMTALVMVGVKRLVITVLPNQVAPRNTTVQRSANLSRVPLGSVDGSISRATAITELHRLECN